MTNDALKKPPLIYDAQRNDRVRCPLGQYIKSSRSHQAVIQRWTPFPTHPSGFAFGRIRMRRLVRDV
ncbi:hypothetical protein CEXT_811221 [Caerostris extrusa]|uniref:Ribosomal protein S14 n=1 Tax=Caerostris extrusa TaxID=172846 RepID=A0AAV4V6V7_CAEEX|nr:hypothetical protein CEXT_811221 [Caerostris extrusa]